MQQPTERRFSPREGIGTLVNAIIDTRVIQCVIRNISTGGALLQVNSEFNSQVSEADVGKPLDFQFLPLYNSSSHNLRGVVKRLMENDGNKFIAVFIEQENPFEQ